MIASRVLHESVFNYSFVYIPQQCLAVVEWLKDPGIEFILAINAVKEFYKDNLLYVTGLNKIQFNVFFLATESEGETPKFATDK